MGLFDRLEDASLWVRPNADAAVLRVESKQRFCAVYVDETHRQQDLAVHGKLDGLIREIHENLPEPNKIAGDPGRDRFGHSADELDGFLRTGSAKC